MDNLRGSLTMVFAMALFAMEDALIKALAGTLPTGQILVFMGLAGTPVFAWLCHRRRIRVVSATFWQRPILIRNLCEIAGAMTFVTALTLIPLATASAFVQAAPLMMTMGAAVLLGETVGWRRWTAIVVGFCGVLLILRPFGTGFDPNTLFALAGVVFLSGRDLVSRRVPRAVPSLLLATYGFAASIPAGLGLWGLDGRFVVPEAADWIKLGGIVAVGVVGYLAVTAASRMGDVSVVTPFRYTRLPFALILGLVIFGERPDVTTLLGALLIICAGLYTLLREAMLKHRAKA